MDVKSNTDKVCIIGAGSSGLAAAKTFHERGIPFDCLEREPDIGGLWNEATGHWRRLRHHLSRLVQEIYRLRGLSPPRGISHLSLASRDARLFARLRRAISASSTRSSSTRTVERAERAQDGWSVQVAGEERPRFYRALVIANGHHHVPRTPKIPGTFTGEILHSRDYRSVKQLADKRVVVVGAGNSACDIVVDATSVAQRIYLSMRRGTYFVPKFMFGRPMDGIINFCEKIPMPRGLAQPALHPLAQAHGGQERALRLARARASHHGHPPDHEHGAAAARCPWPHRREARYRRVRRQQGALQRRERGRGRSRRVRHRLRDLHSLPRQRSPLRPRRAPAPLSQRVSPRASTIFSPWA